MGQARDRLTKLVGQQKKVQVARANPGELIHNGFVLGIGRDLVLLHQFHDFYPEGFTALRVADVRRVRSGEHERFWEEMFRAEGIMERVGIPYEVPLDDFRSLLAALHEKGRHVIVESEGRKSADHDGFTIGRVVDLGEDAVSILNFDPLGVWDDEPCVIDYDDITKIQFDTPYLNTMSKYLKGSAPV